MRKINKNFKVIPTALLECYEAKKANLWQEKTHHQFDEKCYNRSCILELRAIYEDKCAYCERKLYEDDKKRLKEASVEHYRPKSYYWWLGYEWSNLMLVCTDCNSKKGNSFGYLGHKLDNKNLPTENLFCCDSAELLAEKPLMLNPEIDDPSSYFTFDLKGSILPIETDPNKKKRAETTIQYTNLNRFAIQHKERKRKIDEILNDLNYQLQVLYEICPNSTQWTSENICLSFFPTFKKLSSWLDEKAEFTLLAEFLVKEFHHTFIDEFIERFGYSHLLKKVLLFAWNEFRKF
jgi:uncharacterized protein (TIGR02646 family)